MKESTMKMQKGFTLIELMITVAVVSILAMIALPSYSDYVKRGNITEATSNLAGLRVQMEQYYQDNRNYGSGACGVVMPASPSVKYFTFACVPGASPSQTYTITATGAGSMAGFTYTIDQSNNKQTTAAPAGWGPTSTTCWITKQGGAC